MSEIKKIECAIIEMTMSDYIGKSLCEESCNVIIQALQEKLQRENPQPLITNENGDVMLCNHCGTDLMGEFSEPLEEKYCPFCGWAIDLRKSVSEPRGV